MDPKILVVENHHDLRSAIVAAFAREHVPCDAVVTGSDALLKLRDHHYAYVLVDDDEETGAGALIDKLTADPKSPKLILLTEFERDDMPFLRKPFDSKQLLARVSE
jgi:DNA-binding response OmpR family regulator